MWKNHQRQNACIEKKIIANAKVMREKSKALISRWLIKGLSSQIRVPLKKLDKAVILTSGISLYIIM